MELPHLECWLSNVALVTLTSVRVVVPELSTTNMHAMVSPADWPGIPSESTTAPLVVVWKIPVRLRACVADEESVMKPPEAGNPVTLDNERSGRAGVFFIRVANAPLPCLSTYCLCQRNVRKNRSTIPRRGCD